MVDATELLDLFGQVPVGELIASVTADDACNTCGCRDTITNEGAEVMILPRRDSTSWKRDSPGTPDRNRALHASKHLDQTTLRH